VSPPRPGTRDLTVRTGGVQGPTRALIALGVVVAVLAVAVGGLGWLDQRDRRLAAARDSGVQAAREQVVTVLSYDFRTVEEDLRQARGVTTGGFAEEFSSRAVRATARTAREQGIVTRATVVRSAVVRADPGQVVVLLFVNQTTRSSRETAVQVSAHRVELTMTRSGERWLVSRLQRV
jgi:Mce-associated membrane protein